MNNWRTMTLTMSLAPTRKSAHSETKRFREIPKKTVAKPNPATHHSIREPAWRPSGLCASNMAITRSEERRVGKECRSGGAAGPGNKKNAAERQAHYSCDNSALK